MKAMLLAAGRGARMRPLTDHTPKPLLTVGGKALIVWHIENLVGAGIHEIVINHAHLGAQIESALGDGHSLGAQLRYSREATALETAGGIAYALPLLGAEPFAVINSDIFCDYDFAQLVVRAAALQANADAAHLVMVDNPAQHRDGDFALHTNRLVAFTRNSALGAETEGIEDEPTAHNPLPDEKHIKVLTFSGIGIYQPDLFSTIPRGTSAALAPLLRAQIARDKVSAEHHQGHWADVGTPQRLAELDRQVSSLHNAT